MREKPSVFKIVPTWRSQYDPKALIDDALKIAAPPAHDPGD